jgi:hypothetical protein
VAALVATTSFFGPPASMVRAQASDLLPTESELNSTLAPLTVSNYRAGPGNDGWDANAKFDIGGSSVGALSGEVDASELPTSEGAAGFLQTKLQQLRDGTRQAGFVGDIGPSTPELTMDADEAYFGVYATPPGAPPMVVLLQISRYEGQVISTAVILNPNGEVSADAAAQMLGEITAKMLVLMNSD